MKSKVVRLCWYIRQYLAGWFIHLGLFIMPEGVFKFELLDILWELNFKVKKVLAENGKLKDNKKNL